MRRIITLDFDGVITDPYPQTIDYINKEFGTSFVVSDTYAVDSGRKIIGVSQRTLSGKILEYFRAANFETFPLHDGLVEGIGRLSELADLYVVTSCADWWLSEIRALLDARFKGLIEGVHHASSNYFISGGKRLKSEICKELKSALMVEDDLQHAQECYDAGIPTAILNPYIDRNASIIPVFFHWREIVDYAERLFKI